MPAEAPARPTRVRYLVLAAATASAVMLYLDRFCISFAETYIREDLGLSNMEMGWVLSAFFWSYALFQVPSGWLTDRFGARRMLALYVLLWSLLTGLTGLAVGLFSLLAARLAFGLAQAGAYPTCAQLISRWIPFAHRGKASSTVALGGRVGGFLAPVVTAYFVVAFVPVEVPSRLRPEELPRPRQLAAVWVHLAREPQAPLPSPLEGARSASQWIASLFSPAEREQLERIAAGESSAPAKQLAALLNRLLGQPGWALEALRRAPQVKLDRFGQRLVQQARLQPESLDHAAWERLNRLVLERLYPDHVHKIYTRGWRPTMGAFALAGVLLAAAMWWLLRDNPSVDPRCNDAERELIAAGRPRQLQTPQGPAAAFPWRAVLTSRPLWCVCAGQFFTNVGWVFLVTWLPRYLQEVHRLPAHQRGWMAAVPLAAGWVGMLLGGPLTDSLVRRLGLRWGRALAVAGARSLAAVAYLVLLLEPSVWTATAAFAAVAACTDAGTASVWAFNQDVGGRYVASVLGWGNMWGNLGAAILPPLFVWILQNGFPGSGPAASDQALHWNAGFVTCAAAFLLAGVAALGIDASRPIDQDEQAREA